MNDAPIRSSTPAASARLAGENTNHDVHPRRPVEASAGSSRAHAIRSKPGAGSTAGALSTKAITRCSPV